MPKTAPKKTAQPITIPGKPTTTERDELLATLEKRFEENMPRHAEMQWDDIAPRLTGTKLHAVFAMEATGGEPDVVYYDTKEDVYYIVDCSKQSPARRSVCYDEQARTERKKFPPQTSAEELAKEMGVRLLTEEEYRMMQEAEEFDTTTSSWLQTPVEIRKHGGALFGDRRYDHVFVYHNGADSYYGSRGFRGVLLV